MINSKITYRVDSASVIISSISSLNSYIVYTIYFGTAWNMKAVNSTRWIYIPNRTFSQIDINTFSGTCIGGIIYRAACPLTVF